MDRTREVTGVVLGLLVGLLAACEPVLDAPEPPAPDAGNAAATAAAAASREPCTPAPERDDSDPDPAQFRLIGHIDRSAEPQVFRDLRGETFDGIPDHLRLPRASCTPGPAGCSEPDDGSPGILMNARTGAVYTELARATPSGLTRSHGARDVIGADGSVVAADPYTAGGDVCGGPATDIVPAAETAETPSGGGAQFVFSDDDRNPVENSAPYPWRALGVRLQGSNVKRYCSAAMIGPRAALAAAHCISPSGDGTDIKISYGRMGGDDAAASGVRDVAWYYWPNEWTGIDDGSKYDYAVLIFADKPWSPGFVSFGHRGVSIGSRSHAGYPNYDLACGQSPQLPNGNACAGYLYRTSGYVSAVWSYTISHYIDTEDGQSGGPIYSAYGDLDRVIFYLHSQSGNPNTGKRLTSGSYATICKWVKARPSSYFGNIEC